MKQIKYVLLSYVLILSTQTYAQDQFLPLSDTQSHTEHKVIQFKEINKPTLKEYNDPTHKGKPTLQFPERKTPDRSSELMEKSTYQEKMEWVDQKGRLAPKAAEEHYRLKQQRSGH